MSNQNGRYGNGNRGVPNGNSYKDQQMINSSNTLSVLIKKRRKTGLGFSVKERSIKPYTQISYVVRGGSAEETDLIRVGDVILAINHHDLSNMDYQNALQCLRSIRPGGNALLLIKASGTLETITGQNGEVTYSRKRQRYPSSYSSSKSIINNKEKLPLKLSPIQPSQHYKKPALIPQQPSKTNEKYLENGIVAEKQIDVQRPQPKHDNFLPHTRTKAELLQNHESGTKDKEVLHQKACPVNICSKTECRGSLMNPPNMTVDPTKDFQTIDEIRKLAIDFIDQYYDSTKRVGSDAHQSRLNEVLDSLKSTGEYKLTENELIFGAKVAWRNAPRCIGRQQWNKLQVFDCRQITTTEEMFEALCTHMKFATNKGNIRSCITFFPPRKHLSTEFRVWNSQVLRYAAYRQDDDSIIGDPINLEFTQICEKLGWKGKGGRFDILPWVLQANGQDPDVYDVPEELVLEVKIRHPRYKCFEEMDLKWYAVPGVSNIMLNIGGIEFSAAPFNGWFMGTEVGRDLCDVSRYDLLPTIAEKMGLDTKRTSSLWKDTALLETNVAVLHSFQSDNVTIMDHHVASDSFMKHFHNELKVRGGCPADWVWLVPPISGSASPVFHQEFFNYIINPACLYQPNPWKYYKFKDQKKLKSNIKIHFKELAKSVMMTANLMTKAMSKRIRATILYATETGKSLEYAKMLKRLLDHAFDGKIIAMEDYDIVNLQYESLVFVVTSTFGNGDPPINGETFASSLHKLCSNEGSNEKTINKKKGKFQSVATLKPLVKRGSTLSLKSLNTEKVGPLANVRFSVFGLGSRAYPHFCAFAHAVDTMFGELNGERILEIGEGDELCGQAESFRTWSKQVFKAACEVYCIESDNRFEDEMDDSDENYEESRYRLKLSSTISVEDYVEGLSKLHRKKVSSCKLINRTNLQSEKSGRSTILVELQTNKDLEYQPGDHLAIFPKNNPLHVEEILKYMESSFDPKTLIEVESLRIKKTPRGEMKKWELLDRMPKCSLQTALLRYIDISTPPSQQMLKVLSGVATDKSHRERLIKLSEDSILYDEWSIIGVPNYVAVLKEFPSIKLTAPLIFTQLPLLQVRYYSISSSPVVHPGEVHATVAVVRYHTNGGEGELREGVCSNYLNQIDDTEEVPCFIRAAPGFHLPKDPSLPIILVGPGTGIAPYRSFWEQRMFDKIKGSTLVLLFGCRNSQLDHIYKDEVEKCMEAGAITHAYTAFSRDPIHKKKYVQAIIKDEIDEFVFDIITKRNGHLFVCGDVKMANEVNIAVQEIIKKQMKISQEEAAEYILTMKGDQRYHEDIFGVTLRTFEVQQNVRLNSAKSQRPSTNKLNGAVSNSAEKQVEQA